MLMNVDSAQREWIKRSVGWLLSTFDRCEASSLAEERAAPASAVNELTLTNAPFGIVRGKTGGLARAPRRRPSRPIASLRATACACFGHSIERELGANAADLPRVRSATNSTWNQLSMTFPSSLVAVCVPKSDHTGFITFQLRKTITSTTNHK